jgi:hypothetical protein
MQQKIRNGVKMIPKWDGSLNGNTGFWVSRGDGGANPRTDASALMQKNRKQQRTARSIWLSRVSFSICPKQQPARIMRVSGNNDAAKCSPSKG